MLVLLLSFGLLFLCPSWKECHIYDYLVWAYWSMLQTKVQNTMHSENGHEENTVSWISASWLSTGPQPKATGMVPPRPERIQKNIVGMIQPPPRQSLSWDNSPSPFMGPWGTRLGLHPLSTNQGCSSPCAACSFHSCVLCVPLGSSSLGISGLTNSYPSSVSWLNTFPEPLGYQTRPWHSVLPHAIMLGSWIYLITCVNTCLISRFFTRSLKLFLPHWCLRCMQEVYNKYLLTRAVWAWG